MTMQLFLILAVVMCAVSSLLTEALKKAFSSSFPTNAIALIDALVVGGAGTAIAYVFLGISFTLPSILAIVCMVAVVWIGSMTSYDKVIQLIKQIAAGKGE